MPLMLAFFAFQFPAGLSLYWIVSNVVGIIIHGFIVGFKSTASSLNPLSKKSDTEESLDLPKEKKMNDKIFTAKTLEEAIELASLELETTKKKILKLKLLKKAKTAFLGIGGEDAKIRVKSVSNDLSVTSKSNGYC